MQELSRDMFVLPGTNGRFVHLASIARGVREFICFVDTQTQKCYIEEISGGHLEFIEDDELAFDLAKFCEEKGLSDQRRLLEFMNKKAMEHSGYKK